MILTWENRSIGEGANWSVINPTLNGLESNPVTRSERPVIESLSRCTA
jgi:hypothetical protein